MPDFFQTRPLYWDEISVGWPERARTFGMWLQTCGHRNLEGLYRLPLGYVTTDLGWLPRQVEEHLQTLIDACFVQYDRDASLILVPECLRVTQPKSPKQLLGALRVLRRLPRSPLLRSLFELALEPADGREPVLAGRFAVVIANEFGFALPDGLEWASEWVSERVWGSHPNGSTDGSTNGSRNTRVGAPDPDPDPEPDPDPHSPLELPSPPAKQRRSDLVRFEAQMVAWRSSSLPSSQEEERWANARAVLGERLEPNRGGMLLDYLHLHGSPNGRLVLGVVGGQQVETIERRLGRHLAEVVGEFQLVQCGCKVAP